MFSLLVGEGSRGFFCRGRGGLFFARAFGGSDNFWERDRALWFCRGETVDLIMGDEENGVCLLFGYRCSSSFAARVPRGSYVRWGFFVVFYSL